MLWPIKEWWDLEGEKGEDSKGDVWVTELG